jgi:ATP dependent DNA ligase domain
MSLVNRSKMDVKLGGYLVGSTTCLIDPLLVTNAQDYRRNSASRLIPLDATDVLKRFPPGDYTVSRKLDGEFNVLVYDSGELLLVNPGGTVRMGLPFQKEAEEIFKKAKLKKVKLAGELYVKRAEKRERVHDVSRIARTPTSEKELNQLQFAAFDIINIDDAPAPASYREVVAKLTELFKGGKLCSVVEAATLTDAKSIDEQFRSWVGDGAEGAVVRSEAVGQFKIKPRHTIDAVVVGYTEGQDDRTGLLHDLLIAVMRPDGGLQLIGHVGGGFDLDDRRTMLSDLKDEIVESDYAEVNEQVAYHMVKPSWVIEVSVLDVISQSTRGGTINKMVLDWDAAAKKYRSIRRMPSVALISPQFVRKRDDKQVNKQDIRAQQLADLVEIPQLEADARKVVLPGSEVLRREVYTKTLKGAVMVRKLVLWQTNKATVADEFPAFVLHYTDYSPNRKTPLERDIRVSNSREQIDELWNELSAENITKGWDPAGSAKPPATAVSAEAPKKTTRKKKEG